MSAASAASTCWSVLLSVVISLLLRRLMVQARELLTTTLKGGVVKGEGQLRGRGGFGDLIFEPHAAAHGDAVAVALHGQAQGGLQALGSHTTRDAQATAVIAHGAGPDAIDDGPLLGDAPCKAQDDTDSRRPVALTVLPLRPRAASRARSAASACWSPSMA